MWGDGLAGERLPEAQGQVRKHFEGLFLLEIEIEPHDAELDWSAITQPISGTPQDDWQVPFDERQLRSGGNRWAFFFHFLDPQRPLQTPLGECALPDPTPTPPHLQDVEYDLPG